VQAEQYEKFNNRPGAYGTWFKLADLIIAGIPKHQDLKKPNTRQQELLVQYREIVRSKALPRLETLKPLLNGNTVEQPVRPGAALIQASNLPGVDWASQSQTAASAAKPPAPTVDANVGGWLSAPQLAGSASASDDPFAASAAFEQAELPHPPVAGVDAGATV
jgi:hypothetical protein